VTLSGCGTGGYTSSGSQGSGKKLFIQACGGCHTLADAGTSGSIGPNLDDAFAQAREAGMTSDTFTQVVATQIKFPITHTSTGAPGTWTRLLREDSAGVGRTIPITPIRALDTRATGGRAIGAPVIPGQRKGPIRGGQSVTLDLAGIGPIPADASGVIGNATVLTPSASGFLRILPAGAAVPATSFNFQKSQSIANGFTSALTATGIRATAPIANTITYELVIDISAYIT